MHGLEWAVGHSGCLCGYKGWLLLQSYLPLSLTLSSVCRHCGLRGFGEGICKAVPGALRVERLFCSTDDPSRRLLC
jgi:hypothetical protein